MITPQSLVGDQLTLWKEGVRSGSVMLVSKEPEHSIVMKQAEFTTEMNIQIFYTFAIHAMLHSGGVKIGRIMKLVARCRRDVVADVFFPLLSLSCV